MLSIIQLVVLANLVLFVATNPLVARRVLLEDEQCSKASCYKALEHAGIHQEGNAKSDCKSYQEATITKCPKTTTTIVDRCTSTVTVTKKHDSRSNIPRAAMENASPLRENSSQFLVKKSNQAQCPKLSKPSNIPAYAKHACDSSEYASACLCLGYPATTTMLLPISTSTSRHCSITTTKTIYPSCTPGSTTVTHTGTTTVTVISATTVSRKYTMTVVSTRSATATSTTIETKTGYPVTVSTVTTTAPESTITKTTVLDTTVDTTTSTDTTLTEVSTDIETASTLTMTTSTTYTLTIDSASATITPVTPVREVADNIVDMADTSSCSRHTIGVSVVHTVTSTHHTTICVSASTTTTIPATTTVSTKTRTSITVTFPFTTTARTTIAPATTATATKTSTSTITDITTEDTTTATVDITTTITTATLTETAVATETVTCQNGDYCYPLSPGSTVSEITVAQCGMQVSNFDLVMNVSTPTYRDCIRTCMASDECQVFSYQISTSACVVYSDETYNPIPNSDYISGYYDGPNSCELS